MWRPSYKKPFVSKMETDTELKKFEDYLHLEYSQIAQAHFKTLETISTFFKHYLVLMGIPLASLAYFISTKKEALPAFISSFMPLSGALFVIISFIGIFVMIYIINLRMDALLYARTVNGIRKYFYDDANINISTKLRMRTLPQTTFLPEYHELYYFSPVVFAFALLNSAYIYVGESLLHFSEIIFSIYTAFLSLSFFSLHLFVYYSLANYREGVYLKSHIIGIDIDGVLNKHREHFCKLLKEKTGKDIDPKEIMHIPVHESDLGISKEQGISVFNDPKYWIEMPTEEHISENLKKLSKEFNFKIWIFTNRPWPNTTNLSIEDKESIEKIWEVEYVNFVKSLSAQNEISSQVINYNYDSQAIDHITHLWLRKYKISYDKLLIEKISEDTIESLIPFIGKPFISRFHTAIKKRIRFFVEDDWEKAEKLAYICDVVFLFDHPYNQYTDLPNNVIRVNSWNEIYRT